MIIYATADLHGNLPEPPADADLLLLAGDICPDFRPLRSNTDWVDKSGIQQAKWLENQFRPWLEALPCPAVGIWGNHDFIGEQRKLWPPRLPWVYLEDSFFHMPVRRVSDGQILGFKVWGTPWVPGLPYWAFHGRSEVLQWRADLIPVGLDVLMAHGPPMGFGDLVPYPPTYDEKYSTPVEGEHVGDSALTEAIARARPKVVVCGHIHEARGTYVLSDQPGDAVDTNAGLGIPIYNVSAVDENYVLHGRPWTRLHELG
jgi:predicted phosphohydrolase